MKQAIGKYLQYLQSVRNSSPHTILNYGKDLAQFVAYLSPPGEQPPALPKITHLIIREFVGHLHEQRLEPTPKLAKRIPSVLSAEEMNIFLNELAGMGPAAGGSLPMKAGKTNSAGG